MNAPEALFRWSLWNPNDASIAMLEQSIGTFRRFFGDEARYVVYTDAPAALDGRLRADAAVLPYTIPGAEYIDPRATWLKWAPRFRHDVEFTEFRIDADIFLLDEPTELREFIAGDGSDFLATQEEYIEQWPYGNFGARLSEGFAPVNAGLVAQRAGCDLSAEIRQAYQWWSAHVMEQEVLYHDEQGAVCWVLQRHVQAGRVRLLDPARYRIVCPTNAVPVETLDGLIAMHAAYPDHPAFYKFLREISEVSGIPVAEGVQGGRQ
jgi:hypothetical protein